MPITFSCPSCAKLLRVTDTLAGKSVRCPQCQAVVAAPDDIPVVPVVTPSPPPPAPPPEPPAPESAWTPTSQAEVRRERRPFDWRRFSSGCQLVGAGIWIEFVAVVVVFVFVFYTASSREKDPPVFADPVSVGGLIVLTFFVLLLIGSVFAAFGRLRMGAVPDDAETAGCLTAAGILAVLRPLLLVAAGILAAIEISDRNGATTAPSTSLSAALFVAALMFGWLTDIVMLPAMALVGGAARSRPLRRAVGTLCLALLVSTLVWFTTIGTVSALKDEEPETGRTQQWQQQGWQQPGWQQPPPRRPASGLLSGDSTVYIVLAVFVTLYVTNTILHHAVYQAGSALARRAGTDNAD